MKKLKSRKGVTLLETSAWMLVIVTVLFGLFRLGELKMIQVAAERAVVGTARVAARTDLALQVLPPDGSQGGLQAAQKAFEVAARPLTSSTIIKAQIAAYGQGGKLWEVPLLDGAGVHIPVDAPVVGDKQVALVVTADYRVDHVLAGLACGGPCRFEKVEIVEVPE